MEPLFNIPEDFAALSDDELRAFITQAQETAATINAAPNDFISDERPSRALLEEMTAGVAAIESARAELEGRTETAATEAETETAEVEEPVEADLDEAAIAELAARAEAAAAEPEVDPEAEPEAEATEPEPEAVTASAPAPARRAAAAPMPRPARARAAEPQPDAQPVALTAAAENLGYGLGEPLPDAFSIAEMMVARARQLGSTAPEGLHGDKYPIARADWRDRYPEERILTDDVAANLDRIGAVTASIGESFEARRAKDAGSLTASGGLCAPVTPYYQLQMLSQASRPVRAALPAFMADRGGIRHGRPASLGSIGNAIGIITAAEDALGGSSATKTCQRIDCPPFEEVDVAALYHCLEIGNLTARTFPELVAQWNQLVLAAQARQAETFLLDGIDAASAHVDAASLGLGASATIPTQAMTAAVGMRSRHRMEPNTVLRALFPAWVLDLMVSDVYRSQFQRFEMTPERFVSVLRAANIEPTFYLDGATGAGQVFGAQGNHTALLPFPGNVRWYLYPEGSFIYLDGGTLELGLVRDSDLNKTNDFQLFGEGFENVAFVGIESLAITTPTCDSGAVSAPVDVTECGDYALVS